MNNREQIDKAFEILRDCFRAGGKLLLCGNGGSAADCEHIVGELMKGMSGNRPFVKALPAISLCSQTGLITAIANDFGYEWVFAQQVFGYGKPGDVLLAITTSGASKNVLEALGLADLLKLHTIMLTGKEASPIWCNATIHCPGSTAAEIQERHIKVYHELCRRLEEEFFP